MLALSQVHHLTTRRACFLSQQGKYGIGSQVEVLRTDGTWSLAQVKEYDWRAVTYTVMLPDTRLKYAALTLARNALTCPRWARQPAVAAAAARLTRVATLCLFSCFCRAGISWRRRISGRQCSGTIDMPALPSAALALGISVWFSGHRQIPALYGAAQHMRGRRASQARARVNA